jgi:hypothetical protein
MHGGDLEQHVYGQREGSQTAIGIVYQRAARSFVDSTSGS